MTRLYAPNRIKELRKLRGLTQDEVAEGMSGETTKGTIAKLETRRMALSADYILDIARVLSVPPGELLVPGEPSLREVPVLGAVAAGQWRDAIEHADEHIAIPATVHGTNLFALRIAGDSIDRIVPDGGLVVVNPEDFELRDGRLYVVANGSHETTIKQYRMAPPALLPVSNNPEHAPIMIGREPFMTIGRAVWAMFPL